MRPSEVLAPSSRRFRILDEIGRGGYGTVLKAEMSGAGGFRKIVALKLLTSQITASADAARRLRDEARVLGLLRHPALVQVDGLIQIGDGWAVVMEYVEGADLRQILEDGIVPPRAALELVAELAYALDAAWNATSPEGVPLRLVHRDVKPANIRITSTGAVKLLDFGIARAEFEAREVDSRSGLIGTVGYMAPERLEGQDGPEGDVYALGVVLYELLRGQGFGRTSVSRERHEERARDAVGALASELPPEQAEIVSLVADALCYEPAERPTARELGRRCEALAEGLGGDRLRRWASAALERLQAEPIVPRSGLVGATAVEVDAETFSWERDAAPTGTLGRGATGRWGRPLPRWVLPALLAAFLAPSMVGLGVGIYAWSLARRAEPAAAPEQPTGTSAKEAEKPVTHLNQTALGAPPIAAAPDVEAELAATATAAPTAPSPTTARADPPAARAPGEAPLASSPSPVGSEKKEPARTARVGRVEVVGDPATVVLIPFEGGDPVPPGDVPVGDYRVRSTFEGEFPTVWREPIRVTEGGSLTVRCSASFLTCTPE